MSNQWKLTLVTMAACVLAIAAPQAASEQLVGGTASSGAATEYDLVALSVDADGEGRPVVTLSSDGPIDYESFVLDGPDRLVVDLAGVVNRLDRYKYPVQAGGVAQVRAGQHQLQPQPVTRVVFDLHGPLAYRIDQFERQLIVSFGDPPPVAEQVAPHEPDIVISGASSLSGERSGSSSSGSGRTQWASWQSYTPAALSVWQALLSWPPTWAKAGAGRLNERAMVRNGVCM